MAQYMNSLTLLFSDGLSHSPFFLTAPFPDRCLLVPFWLDMSIFASTPYSSEPHKGLVYKIIM